jgi:hypothetical protein
MESMSHQFSAENKIKASFHHIYISDDPKAYYSTLGNLGYTIPDLAQPVFHGISNYLIAEKSRPITILDVGCSYGVNAALLKCGLSFRQLRDRYISNAFHSLSSQQTASYDHSYFRGWPLRKDLRIIGIDASAPAVDYALKVGLLDAGIALDLEKDDLDAAARTLIAGADLIISTGCVGYVTATTFDKLLGVFPQGGLPWVVSFVLRMFAYDDIADRLERGGLLTERYAGATFVQRRFRDKAEQAGTLAASKARGIDPSGKEAEGAFHSELFVSRPVEALSAIKLEDLLPPPAALNLPGLERRTGSNTPLIAA